MNVNENEIVFTPTPEDGAGIAPEDIKHHSKVFGTASKGVDTSPVACVERGMFPIEYLDEFTEKSSHFQDIQRWKAKQSVK